METLPVHESAHASLDDPNNGCDRHCSNCNTTVTPLWRKFGPVKFLCNACGLYYKVNGDHRPYYMSKNKLNSSSKKLMLRCANCGTNKTTMWRKNGGTHVCNACGLYFRINGHNRPVTMRKDIIRTRRRRDTAYDMLELSGAVSNGSLLPGQGLECDVEGSLQNTHSSSSGIAVTASAAAAAAAAMLLKDIKSEPADECVSSSSVASSSSSPPFDLKSVSSCTSGYFSSFASHTPHTSSPVSSSTSGSGLAPLPVTISSSLSSASPLSLSSSASASSLSSLSSSSSSATTPVTSSLAHNSSTQGHSSAYPTMMLNISKEQFSISVDFSNSVDNSGNSPLNLNYPPNPINGPSSLLPLCTPASLNNGHHALGHNAHSLSHSPSHQGHPLAHSPLHSHHSLAHSSSLHHHFPMPVNSNISHLSPISQPPSQSSPSSPASHQTHHHHQQLQSMESLSQNHHEHSSPHQSQQTSLYQLTNSCSRQSAMFPTNGVSLHHHLDAGTLSSSTVPSSPITSPQIVSNNISACSPTALSSIDMTASQLLNSNSANQFDVNNYYCHFF